MTPEEELLKLRQENKALHERLAQRDELIAQLQQQVQALEEREESGRTGGSPRRDAAVACLPRRGNCASGHLL
jgi:hypothetical protein